MSSTNVGPEQTDEPPHLSIQTIIETITNLHKLLSSEGKQQADSPEPVSTTDNQTGANQDASYEGNNDSTGNQYVVATQQTRNESSTQDGEISQEINNTDDARCCPGFCPNKNGIDIVGQDNRVQIKKKDEDQKKADDINKKEQVIKELDKVCIELQYMMRSFEKLRKFENELKGPLETLKANVDDILKDLPQVKEDKLPKQVPNNLRVLRDNITKVKILIPSQHQTSNKNTEANRPLQTTVATTEAQDLPQLYGENVFEDSYYFKEIEEKYNELDDRQKLCLFCLVNFPEKAEIKKRLLRFWWVGEDLFRDKDPKDEMKLVNEILQLFEEKGFIEPVKKKNKLQPRSYKMNPIVRSCLIKFAKDANFFDYNSEGKPTMDFSVCKKACMVKSEGASASKWFSDYLKGEGTGDRLPADLVKLQMLFNFPEKKTLLSASERFSELQTLFNISKQFPALPKEWLSKMTGLKVLYLGKWESFARHIEVEDIDFLKGLKNMKKLRLLSFQGVSGIPKLPSAVCKLENLKIIDLRACHNLEKLPDGIGALKELTYMDLSECYLLDDVPKQLNKLDKLQVLKGFVIGDANNSCTLRDLSQLKNLRKLSVNVNTDKFDIDEAGKDLALFVGLEKLKIAWGSGSGYLAIDDSWEGIEDSKPEKLKSKTKNQLLNGNGNVTKPSSTKAETKAKEKSNRVEENTKTMNQEEEKKKSQNVGAVASELKPNTRRFKAAINSVMAAAHIKDLRRAKITNPPQGLEKLLKLDLQCYPNSTPPCWLKPGIMFSLRNLSIKGGKMGELIQEGNEKWEVSTLRLKFLLYLKMDWKEMLFWFPKLKYLEKDKCPRITFCPCDANGVCQNSKGFKLHFFECSEDFPQNDRSAS